MTTKVSSSVIADRSVGSLQLANTAVTAGSYGSSSQIPTVTVDAQGRITGASQSAVSSISIADNQITGMTAEIKMWPTTTAPTGYLLCNGAAVSRSTYSALFAIIGTTFGSGNGSTTFNLPNYQDRMPIGAGNTYSLGATGGSKDATLISHSHSAVTNASDSGHTHTVEHMGSTGADGPDSFTGGGFVNVSTTSGTGFANITATTTIGNTGSGDGTNANLPPYIGINFIIRY